MNDFYINVKEDSEYPPALYNYSPHIAYPEYIWGKTEVSKDKNDIYEMVRNCFIGMNMDSGNINTKDWNPFTEFINADDTVVIKPNWVMHYNKNKSVTENSLECLITHPSIVRAVIDYCLIALKGTGRIIVGDAPMQGCNLDRLIEISGYKELFSFYNSHSINITPIDFREYSTIVDKNKVLIGRKYNTGKSFEVEMGSKSRFYSEMKSSKPYKVSDYNSHITNNFHNDKKHSYLINQEVLSADVVINIPKPKCHRLAGITAGVKNIVGITYDKSCLPHRTEGSKQEGGDEYLYKSTIKNIIGKVLNKKIVFEEKKNIRLSLAMRYLYGGLYHTMKRISKDKFLLGSWHGNDTIWRTILDLYHILLYSDKKGIVCETRQRRIFNLADMVIAGERNGPVSPEPKKIGVIIAGTDAVVLDRLVCNIMGFDYEKIPSVSNACNDDQLLIKENTRYILYSNIELYNGKNIDQVIFPSFWKFKPYDTWKGYIEKK